MGSIFWWIKIIAIAVISLFFITFSLTNLISSYQLHNPQEFVMAFFSHSLMHMISTVGLIYSTLQLYYHCKGKKAE